MKCRGCDSSLAGNQIRCQFCGTVSLEGIWKRIVSSFEKVSWEPVWLFLAFSGIALIFLGALAALNHEEPQPPVVIEKTPQIIPVVQVKTVAEPETRTETVTIVHETRPVVINIDLADAVRAWRSFSPAPAKVEYPVDPFTEVELTGPKNESRVPAIPEASYTQVGFGNSGNGTFTGGGGGSFQAPIAFIPVPRILVLKPVPMPKLLLRSHAAPKKISPLILPRPPKAGPR